MSDCGCGVKGNQAEINYSPAELNSEWQGKSNGRPIVYWPGWVMNDARFSSQTDINPLPIVPVHFQNWPEMQYQLSNGWQYTNYGERMAYDDYLRMLYSSNSSPGAPAPLPGEGTQPQQVAQVSQKTIQNTILVNNEPSIPTGFSRVGARTFYG